MTLKLPRRLPPAASVLLWYLRALAVFYFLSGLSQWAWIIGARGKPITEAEPHVQIAAGYFALLEPVAAVGLWCGAAWGVAAWLFASVAELVMHLGFADLFGVAWATVIFHIVTILFYVGLAWWTGATENTGEVLRLPPE